MMKKNFVSVLLIFFLCNIFSQNFEKSGEIENLDELSYEYGLLNEIKFKNQTITISNFENEEDFFESQYFLQNYDKVSFLNLEKTQEKVLVLANEDLLLMYTKDAAPWIFATNLGRRAEGLYFANSIKFTATSELVEQSTVYAATNLQNLNLNKPWVEGVSGNGEGEKINFSCNASTIYFLSGYVSFSKPYLYEQNSRPKKIKLFLIKNNKKEELIFDLKDTPNPQELSLGEYYKGPIELEIMEVYEGTKYQDTCINGLIFSVF